MKIVLFVPIKLNSVRLPNKMLLPLGDKLLCQYIFNTLIDIKKDIEKESMDINIYCYCSDKKIKQYLPNNVTFLKRDYSLDSNETKGIDIYKSFVEKIDSDIYCLCHATSPFVKKTSIINGINKIIIDDYDSSFSVSKIQTFTWYKNKPLNYKFENVIRTQSIEPIYWETSAFYIFKKEILEKYNRRIGFNYCMIETNRIESIDIDDKEDYDLATCIINNDTN